MQADTSSSTDCLNWVVSPLFYFIIVQFDCLRASHQKMLSVLFVVGVPRKRISYRWTLWESESNTMTKSHKYQFLVFGHCKIPLREGVPSLEMSSLVYNDGIENQLTWREMFNLSVFYVIIVFGFSRLKGNHVNDPVLNVATKSITLQSRRMEHFVRYLVVSSFLKGSTECSRLGLGSRCCSGFMRVDDGLVP